MAVSQIVSETKLKYHIQNNFGINMDYNVQMSKHNYTPYAGKQTPIRKNVLTKFRIENHCSCEHCSNREIVFVQMTVNLANIVN